MQVHAQIRIHIYIYSISLYICTCDIYDLFLAHSSPLPKKETNKTDSKKGVKYSGCWGSAVQPTSFFMTYVQQQKVSPSMVHDATGFGWHVYYTSLGVSRLRYISSTNLSDFVIFEGFVLSEGKCKDINFRTQQKTGGLKNRTYIEVIFFVHYFREPDSSW